MNEFLELPYETLSIFSFIVAQVIVETLDIDHQNTLLNVMFLIGQFVRLNISQKILLRTITPDSRELQDLQSIYNE